MMKTIYAGMMALVGIAALSAGLVLRLQTPDVAFANKPAAKSTAKSEAKDKDAKTAPQKSAKVVKMVKSEAEWKKLLTPEQFYVMREKGTQAPFQGDYHPRKEIGVYRCSACDLDLFRSETKFDSGTGWPSFWQPIAGHVEETTDADGERTEVTCARCGGHLGHVFDDGPQPTGLRYCMNAVALKFEEQKN